MAADLPRFIETQAFTPQTITSSAPVFTTMADVFHNVQVATSASVKQAAVEKAELAGREAGQTQKVELRAGFGESNIAFNKMALQANREYITSQAVIHSKQLLIKAQLNPNAREAMQNYTVGMQSYTKTFVNGVSVQNKTYAQNLLQFQAANGVGTLVKRVSKQDHLNATAHYTSAQIQLQEEITDAINAGQTDEAKDLAGQKAAQTTAAEARGIVEAPEAVKSLQKDHVSFNAQTIAANFRLAIQKGQGEAFLKKFSNSNPPGMTQVDQIKTLQTLKSIAHRAFLSANLDANNTATIAANDLASTSAGGTPNLRVQTLYNQFFPEKAEKYAAAQAEAELVTTAVNTATNLPLSAQQDYINQNFAPPKGALFNSPETKRFNLINRKVAQFNHTFQSDPVAILNQEGAVKAAREQVENMNEAGAQAFVNGGVPLRPIQFDPDETLINLQKQHGTHPDKWQILSNNVAKGMVGKLQGMKPQGKLEFFQQLARQHPNFPQIAMRDLVRQGLPPGDQFAVGNLPNDPRLIDWQTAQQNTEKQLIDTLGGSKDTRVKNILAAQPEAGGFFGGGDTWNQYLESFKFQKNTKQPQYNANLRNFIVKGALAYATNHPSASASDAIEQMADFSPAGKYNYIDLNGHTIRIPTKFNPEVIRNTLEEKQRTELKVFDAVRSPVLNRIPSTLEIFKDTAEAKIRELAESPLGTALLGTPGTGGLIQQGIRFLFPEPPIAKEAEFNAIIKPGGWQTNAINTGVVWVDSTGNEIKNKEGQSFGKSFEDATNPDAVQELKEETNRNLILNSAEDVAKLLP